MFYRGARNASMSDIHPSELESARSNTRFDEENNSDGRAALGALATLRESAARLVTSNKQKNMADIRVGS